MDFKVERIKGEKAILVLTNYNSFPVTVLLKYEYYCPFVWFEETTSAVIGVNGVKRIETPCGDDARLVGMIVRKLAQ